MLSHEERQRAAKLTEAEIRRLAAYRCGEARGLLQFALDAVKTTESRHAPETIRLAAAAAHRAYIAMDSALGWVETKGPPEKPRAWVTPQSATVGENLRVEGGAVGELLKVEEGWLFIMLPNDLVVKTDLAERETPA